MDHTNQHRIVAIQMDRNVFKELLQAAASEIVETTRPRVVDALPDEYRYRCGTNLGWTYSTLTPLWDENEPLLDEEGAVDVLWKAGTVPENIMIGVASVERGFTVLHLRPEGRYVDPCSAECRREWMEITPGVRDFLPFLKRCPPPPVGWMVYVQGVPSWDLSLAEHGRYPLPKRAAA